MGLLDSLFGQSASDPRSQAMAALSAGLLNRNVGGGLLAANQVFAMQPELQRRAELENLRMGLLRSQVEENDAQTADRARQRDISNQLQDAARQSYISPDNANARSMGPMPDGSNMPTVQPGFDSQQFMGRAFQIDPFKALEMRDKFAPKEVKPLVVGGSLVTPDGKEIYRAPKEQATPSAIQEYEYAKAQGFGGSFADFEMSKRRAGASNVSVNTGQKGLDNELKIRSDFRSEPIYKAHNEVQSAHSQITASLKQQSPAGDLAGATKIMKILDPGSVVRESELGMAMAATGALDRLTNYAGMVVNGTKLTPKQRADFQNLADKLYSESANQYNAKRKEYAGFATDYNLNGDRILGPAVTSPRLPSPAAAPGAGPSINDLLKKYGQ